MPDKDNFIVTGNSTAANNSFTGVSNNSSRSLTNELLYGRVTSVNNKDRSIAYELVNINSKGTSAINNNKQLVGIAYNYNPQFTRLPIVGEIVPLIKGPSDTPNSSTPYRMYYQSPISVQNTVNDNKVPPIIQKSTQDLNSNYKLNNVGIKTTTNPPKGANREGTDLDGINGEYTSQFKFPPAFLITITFFKDKKIEEINQELGLEGNDTLGSAAKNLNLTSKMMYDWNDFVDWMDKNGYKGEKNMNNKQYSKNVWVEYVTKVKKDFWVKYIKPDLTSDDVRKIQQALQIYRADIINRWRTGKITTIQATTTKAYIPMQSTKSKTYDPNDQRTWVQPNIPEDVKAVYDRFMTWAKPVQYN